MRKLVFRVSKQTGQPQKMARGMKFQMQEVERFYYLCSENKGTDQLCGYRAADLHLCFGIFSHNTAHTTVWYVVL